MRRSALPLLSILFVLAACGVLWVLAYALVTGLTFKSWALFTTVTQSDPFAAIRHVRYYWSHAAVQRNAFVAGGLSAGLMLAGGVAAFLTRKPQLHGDARFARGGEIMKANLMARRGLILGRHSVSLLRNDDPTHVLVVGPTRSGKGVGFVIPNGLGWDGSLVCLDIKQENVKAFGAARQAAGDEVFVFAPGSTRTHRYNPLDF